MVFLFGLLAVLYPAFAAWYSERHYSEVITDYQQVVIEKDDSELEAYRAAAQAYNDALFSGSCGRLDYEQNGYFSLLDPGGRGIMCYLDIPKIGVHLPVYHGVDANVLATGAGHMPETSLPIGGTNTHAVISAHTGMASSPLFSDLELLEEGDIFFITVLGEKLAYQVDQIKTVLPTQIDDLLFVEGRDLVTLLTCTPYGVNTHRLLVRGSRIDWQEPEEEETLPEAAEPDAPEEDRSVIGEQYIQSIVTGLLMALPLLLILLLVLTVQAIRRKRRLRHEAAA